MGAVILLIWLFPFSLADYGRIVHLFTRQTEREQDLPGSDEIEPLRGTIYDRNFTELAVSYRLYTLYVHPAELRRKEEAAEKLTRYIGGNKDSLLDVFRFSQRSVKLADVLDEHQARNIAALDLAGVFTVPVEERFYPAHTAAAHVLGFTQKGRGLAGAEVWFDMVLQPGEFSGEDIPGLEVDGQTPLGRTTSDVILTLDLDMQRRIEEKLQQYLDMTGRGEGMAMVLEPSSGRVLALAGGATYNPNYFWLAREKARRLRPGCLKLDSSLLRPLLVRGAAVRKYGSDALLPQTVAAPDFGVSKEDLASYEQSIGLTDPVESLLAECSDPADEQSSISAKETPPGITSMQAAVTLMSQINGGWRYTPFILDSVYDHSSRHFYPYRFDTLEKKYVFTPSLGVRTRRHLLRHSPYEGRDGFVYSRSVRRVATKGSTSRYVLEDLVVALPAGVTPRIMLLMLVRRGSLYPLSPDSGSPPKVLTAMVQDILPILEQLASREEIADLPAEKNEENFRRFLISRRIDYKEKATDTARETPTMPSLVNLSLRKALQRLNGFDVRLRITGSGKVVSQKPRAGSPLARETECTLVLR